MNQLIDSTTQNINAIHTKNIGLTEDLIVNMQVFAKNLRKPSDKFEVVCNVPKIDMLTARDQELIFPIVVAEQTFASMVTDATSAASESDNVQLKQKVEQITHDQRKWLS
jgi:hypothetical protein